MKGKTDVPNFIKRYREARDWIGKFCLARYGQEMGRLQYEVACYAEWLEKEFSKAWSAQRLNPSLLAHWPEYPFSDLLRLLLFNALTDAIRGRNGKELRLLADLVEHLDVKPVDLVRARLVGVRENQIYGEPLMSSMELRQLVGDDGPMYMFRRKLKEAGVLFVKQQGKGGGRPRKLPTRKRRK
jgi:hypothetical protein